MLKLAGELIANNAPLLFMLGLNVRYYLVNIIEIPFLARIYLYAIPVYFNVYELVFAYWK